MLFHHLQRCKDKPYTLIKKGVTIIKGSLNFPLLYLQFVCFYCSTKVGYSKALNGAIVNDIKSRIHCGSE